VREVGASVDIEFLVGVAEMCLDGLWGDEQRLSDLRGAASFGGHVGDAGLGGGQGVAAGACGPAGARPCRQQLLAGAFGEDWCPTVVGQVEPFAQRNGV